MLLTFARKNSQIKRFPHNQFFACFLSSMTTGKPIECWRLFDRRARICGRNGLFAFSDLLWRLVPLDDRLDRRRLICLGWLLFGCKIYECRSLINVPINRRLRKFESDSCFNTFIFIKFSLRKKLWLWFEFCNIKFSWN